MAVYNSSFLKRAVSSTQLASLSSQDLKDLTEELFSCIEDTTSSLEEINLFEEKHGYEPDSEWQYRAKKKLRIAKQFAAKIELLGVEAPMTYRKLYQFHLVEILSEELGPAALKKIQDEAAALARRECSPKKVS